MLGTPKHNKHSLAQAWVSVDSIVGSFDTAESFSIEGYHEKHNTLIPSENKILFKNVPPGTPEYYYLLYSRLVNEMQLLEEMLPSVNVRDDCSVIAKNVALRLPDRRRTVPSKFT